MVEESINISLIQSADGSYGTRLRAINGAVFDVKLYEIGSTNNWTVVVEYTDPDGEQTKLKDDSVFGGLHEAKKRAVQIISLFKAEEELRFFRKNALRLIKSLVKSGFDEDYITNASRSLGVEYIPPTKSFVVTTVESDELTKEQITNALQKMLTEGTKILVEDYEKVCD